MASKIEKIYMALIAMEKDGGTDVSPSILVITFLYLVAVLSVPLYAPQKLIWLAAYPIIASEVYGIGYSRILYRSLWILPLLAIIGMFNPILDHTEAFRINGLLISRGWVSFISILLRGVLALQAVVIMVTLTGFLGVFNLMMRLGFPKVLCTQLLLTYRYLFVIMEEAINMKRARDSRGYGRKSYPLGMWGRFIGQLLIRSTQRSIRIHRAMKARGFSGVFPLVSIKGWDKKAWITFFGWIIVIVLLRFVDFSYYFKALIRN
ncbi:MAG: energy-coupling factor transporter transmembrane protein EcfT [Muribaculaceae bacterium]|nr:energy-coupling factor transporter transmembrane protein EcfT [Muribaculaceae bacterium]